MIDGRLLLTLHELPLVDLADQLEAWVASVDDGAHCRAFHFVFDGPRDLREAFRIVPRPMQWQFTSRYEIERHPRLLEIGEVKDLVRTFVTDVKQAGGAA